MLLNVAGCLYYRAGFMGEVVKDFLALAFV